tara:strand:- start:3044 stop:4057 length:1014 start_codon:yes stop_codon:yes gene_type:complete
MRLLILFLSLISTHSLWHEELEGGARLRALDRSKMFDIKIRGHGYFQYIMNVDNRLATLCSGSETATSDKVIACCGGNSILHSGASTDQTAGGLAARVAECYARANTFTNPAALTGHIGYQIVYSDSGTAYTCEVFKTTTTTVTQTDSTGSKMYTCTNLLGTHYDSYETGTAAPIVYNKYGRFHINKYGYLCDPNGVLLLGYQEETTTKGGIHIPSRWDKVIIDNFGRVIVEHDFGGFQTAGRIRLARFSSEQGLGLYLDAPIKSQCSAENSLGFALGSWCEGTDLDGLDIWYYVESDTSGDPILGYPADQGLGATIQYELASTAADLYVGGVTPTV